MKGRGGVLAILLTVVAVALVIPARVDAYDNEHTHQYIVEQAAQVFSFPELGEYLSAVRDGAYDEDETDHVYDFDLPYGTHFWDADAGNLAISHLTAFDLDYPNAWVKARYLFNWVFLEYLVNANKSQAYEYLGHTAHLIADMTVPAHVHVDSHVLDEAYEDWVSNGAYSKWNASHAVAAGGLVPIPPGVHATIYSFPFEEQPWPPYGPGADLYYLMYTANQTADYFASDEDDGDSNDWLGWMDYTGWPDSPRTTGQIDDNSTTWVLQGFPPIPIAVDNDNDDDGDLSRIGDKCFVYAIRATATLFKSFRDEIDCVPPATGCSLAGTEGADDWYTSDVEVTLGARDWDTWEQWVGGTGIHETAWRYPGKAWHSYTAPFGISEEGITQIEYRSMDRFGNLEETKTATIKIDKGAPVVSVSSPDPAGVYLTSGTLIVDYATSDPVSGIHRDRAELDGAIVADGQVVDLGGMAGDHTFTVTAVDNAGNRTDVSFDFSVKIAATVDYRPDVLNVKAKSQTSAAYLEFPAGYDVNLIAVPTVTLTVNGQTIPAYSSPTTVGDYDHDGIADRMVRFDRQAIIAALGGLTGNIPVTVSGALSDGTEFVGSDTVLVVRPGK